jgi:hypothetical protein
MTTLLEVIPTGTSRYIFLSSRPTTGDPRFGSREAPTMRTSILWHLPKDYFDLIFSGSRHIQGNIGGEITTMHKSTYIQEPVRVAEAGSFSRPTPQSWCGALPSSLPSLSYVPRGRILGGNFIRPTNDELPCRKGTTLSGHVVWHLLCAHDDANKDKQPREKALNQPAGMPRCSAERRDSTIIYEADSSRRVPRSRHGLHTPGGADPVDLPLCPFSF